MSRHTNKYWVREKEFISLKNEQSHLWITLPKAAINRIFGRPMPSTRLKEVERKLRNKFYDEYHGRWHTSPRCHRKMLNKIQRAKSKQTIHKILRGDSVVFSDGYRGCNWYW